MSPALIRNAQHAAQYYPFAPSNQFAPLNPALSHGSNTRPVRGIEERSAPVGSRDLAGQAGNATVVDPSYATASAAPGAAWPELAYAVQFASGGRAPAVRSSPPLGHDSGPIALDNTRPVNSGPNAPAIAATRPPGINNPKAPSTPRPILPAPPPSPASAHSYSQNGRQAQYPSNEHSPTSPETPARPRLGRIPKAVLDAAIYATHPMPDSAPLSTVSAAICSDYNPLYPTQHYLNPNGHKGGKGGVSLASARGPVGIKKSLATKHENPPKMPNGDKKGKAPVYPKQNSPPISSPDRPRAPVANMYGNGEQPLPDIPLGPGNWLIKDGGDDNDSSVAAINTPNSSECSGSSATLPHDLVDQESIFGHVDAATNYGDGVVELEPKYPVTNLVPATNVHESLQVAREGKFQLGPQWQVPNARTAHNNAGPSSGHVSVWSEHELEVERPVRRGIWEYHTQDTYQAQSIWAPQNTPDQQQQRAASASPARPPVPPNSPNVTYITDTVLIQEGPLNEDLTMSGALGKNHPKSHKDNHH
ncbi:hypothetical protein GGR51DRAFT_578212 [Nemania sp. FL0031]|nr:hypothetical protein GGR51DRAFT_578212 [Nemania sp. FL0031]